MKKLPAIAVILLIAMEFTSINITFAAHTATIAWVKEPVIDPSYSPHPGAVNEYYWNGTMPKWINFTVKDNGPDPIREIKIVFKKDADGNSYFNFSQTRQGKTGWYATPDEFGPNKRPTVLYFRTDSNYVQSGETVQFGLYMTEGPKDEDRYNIDVWTVDAGPSATTNFFELFILIDNYPPKVEIVYPANGTLFQDGDTVRVKANVTDMEGAYLSGIKRVELWFRYVEKNGTSSPIFIDIMKYNNTEKLYYWNSTSGKLRDEAWHNATVIAYDYAENQKVSSNYSMFFWFKPKPPLTIKTIDPCFLQNQKVGHVGSNVTVEAKTGFKPNSTVTVYFGTINMGNATTTPFGGFTLTFKVPEVPRNTTIVDPSKTLPYTIKLTDGSITNTTDFTVIPWMLIDKKEGLVGDRVTVTGKGFAPSVSVNVFYRDVGLGTVYWEKDSGRALEWSEDAMKLEWTPYLSNLTMGSSQTNPSGTFTLTFNIPASYGGWHPIFGREASSSSGVRSGWMSGVTPAPAPDKAYPEAAFFKVGTKIWIEQDVGLSGQYIAIKASGLPLPEYANKTFDCKAGASGTTQTEEHNWTLALDFGPNKYWIFEKGYILNNEFDYAWSLKAYLPFAYYNNHKDTKAPTWNGTLYWIDAQGGYHMGSQFLKVPALMPGDYEISLYEFNMTTHTDDIQYKATTIFTDLKDPLYVRVNTGTLYFKGENVTVYSEMDLDGVATDPTVISAQLYYENTLQTTLTMNQVATGIYTTTFACPSQNGNYFIKVNATKTFADFNLSGFGTSSFIVSPTLDGLNATLTAINNDIATVNTTLGTIALNLSDINGRVTSIEGNIATIRTDIGQIKTDISSINGRLVQIDTITTTLNDINQKVIVLTTNVATIQTTLGTITTPFESINAQITAIGADAVEIKTAVGDIQGRVTSIQGKTLEIETSIGTMSTTVESIKAETGLQPTNIAISLIAAIAAIIAAILIFRKLYS